MISDMAVDENIQKARRAFFALGSTGLFQSRLNLWHQWTCVKRVFPVLLYSCENWILNHQLIEKLESFQTQLGKIILRLSKATENTVSLLALRWPSKSAISWDLSKEPSETRMALAHPYCRQWLLMSVSPWQSSSVWSWRNPSRDIKVLGDHHLSSTEASFNCLSEYGTMHWTEALLVLLELLLCLNCSLLLCVVIEDVFFPGITYLWRTQTLW